MKGRVCFNCAGFFGFYNDMSAKHRWEGWCQRFKWAKVSPRGRKACFEVAKFYKEG